jgi:hypothetical protein
LLTKPGGLVNWAIAGLLLLEVQRIVGTSGKAKDGGFVYSKERYIGGIR